MAVEAFVGRKKESESLKDLFEGCVKKGLVIQSIEGPSGIGKSSVLWKALETIDLESRGFLKLELTGANRGVEGPDGELTPAAVDQLVNALIQSAVGPEIGLKPPGYYFPKSRDAIAAIARVRGEIKRELAEHQINPEDAQAIASFLKSGATFIGRVGKFIPKVKEFVNSEAIGEVADNVEPSIGELKALSSGTVHFWERLGLGSKASLREAVKTDPEEVLASALVADLKAILLGEHEGKLQPGHGKVKRLERLFLVVEDYEAVHKPLGSFLLPKLVGKLKASEIDATMIVLTRFRLKATNSLWKDFAAQLKQPVVLKPLDRPEVAELLASFDVTDALEHERAWRETSGLPYHLSLLIDEIESGGRSSTTLMELYQRTTMWMSRREVEWLHQILFLDVVRVDTLAQLLGSEDEAERAFNWFEREGSVLDQSSNEPKMLEFVRSRLREYLDRRNFRLSKELRTRAENVVVDA